MKDIWFIKGPAYNANHVAYNCYLAQFEPKKVEEALKDENWVESMHQDLHQFVRNDVWELVPRPKDLLVHLPLLMFNL